MVTSQPWAALLRTLTPTVIGILVRRGANFAAAEDAVQDALVEAVRGWPDDPPRDPKGWLVTVAWRKFVDAARADTSRRHREGRVEREPMPGPGEEVDDTLQLYFLCAHPSLTPASAVALTLRAVGGLTTRQIAQAYLVPEATMAQRISRAKRTVGDVRFDQPGDLATVLRVLYLVFNEGCTGDVDLAAEAIRLARQLASMTDDARSTAETDWVQIVEWYDELVALTESPVVRLNRAVAVGEADGGRAGLAALAEVDPALPRHAAARAYLHERARDL